MSVRQDLVEVVCDGPDAATPCPDGLAWTDYGSARSLRRRMRGDGWRTGLKGGIDRCAGCKAAAA